jgi:arylsulfatase A-like enzyme
MLTTHGAGLALAALAGTALAACGGGPEHPNVILISVDMLRPDHLSCYGYARTTSPNIDRLAAEGALFENHIASSSWTLPSHAAIFTSLPDSLHGCTDTDKTLAPSAVTLAERFQSAGYATAGFFSGPYLHPAFGLGQGFETYENCTSYAKEIDGRPVSEWAMDKEVMIESHKDVTNERVYGAVKRWMGGRSDKPFFLFVHMWDVHFDFTPPPPFDRKFDPGYQGWMTGENFFFDMRYNPDMAKRDLDHLIALYDGEIAWTDSVVGRIRDDLEKAGLLNDTVIALTSDHGTEFFEHGDKGHRKTLYDEVIKTALVVRYPKKLHPGRRVAEQTRGIDVGPTLLELAGLPAPEDVVGRSLVALAETPGSPNVGRAVSELFCVGRNMRSVRTLKWKLVDQIGRPDHWYYDLQRDPGETKELTDFDSDLGKKAKAGYESEIEALDAFASRHEVPAAQGAPVSNPPPEIREQLRKLGYPGGDPTQELPKKQ